MLGNGLLLSCAYDGYIKCWRTWDDALHGQIFKENQQLRCMGAVTESGTLLIGTNTLAILTQSITDWVNYCRDDDALSQYARQAIGAAMSDSEYGNEEHKEYSDYDGEGYDPLEGQTLDDAVDKIFADNLENLEGADLLEALKQ